MSEWDNATGGSGKFFFLFSIIFVKKDERREEDEETAATAAAKTAASLPYLPVGGGVVLQLWGAMAHFPWHLPHMAGGRDTDRGEEEKEAERKEDMGGRGVVHPVHAVRA